MSEKRPDDQVKLVNISGEGKQIIDGKEVGNSKRVVEFTFGGDSKIIKDFIVIEREIAEHGIKKTYIPGEGRHMLKIEELPEGRRSRSDLSKSAEDAQLLKVKLTAAEAAIEKLKAEKIELLEENERLRRPVQRGPGRPPKND